MKSAKFGGKLSVFKKVARNAQMTSSEFARASEKEFSAMMSTLRNSYKQTHAKVRKICFEREAWFNYPFFITI